MEVKGGTMARNTPRFYAFLVALGVVCFCIGILAGFYAGKNRYESDGEVSVSPSKSSRSDAEREEFYKSVFQEMKADNIRSNLKNYTALPHPPGLAQNEKLGNQIADEWGKHMDKIEKFKYNIYLSYPEAPGEITLHQDNGKNFDKKKLVINNEPSFDESEKNNDKLLYPFNAFSGRGTVTAEIVYGNYGLDKDFDTLKNAGIDVEGKIMIFRYGKTARSRKVERSEARKAVGVIIFTDPSDHTVQGEEYPKGWMLNRYGVQRGTVNRLPGDALSIGYPSKDNYFRKDESKYSGNPAIPSQPISYSTAYEILQYMKLNDNDTALPSGFQGGLNFTYPLTSGKGRNVTLNVSTILETKATYTICGTIFGQKEPDRYVMLGNHRDGWTYGACDPSSGTAVMSEIVRSLGAQKKKGWRPQRSIMTCSWGAEEPGIQGSTEWADENHKFLTNNVAAYLNVDMAVEGNFTVRMKVLDYLADGILKMSKLIEAPSDSSVTLYEDWLAKSKIWRNNTSLTKPYFVAATSGSDYKALWHTYGTPIADFRYIFDKVKYKQLPQNPHYHTAYESFGWMDKKLDPGFIHHLAIGRLWAGHLLLIAESDILPYDLVQFTEQLQSYFKQFDDYYKEILGNQTISLDFAKQRINALLEKCKTFQKHVDAVKKSKNEDKDLKLRAINDKLMNFERNFIIKGLAKNEATRHAVYATSSNTLKSMKFNGIGEAIKDAVKNGGDWDEVRKQITLLVWCIDTANRSLDVEKY
ncbi:N-acetylated-alpha-linked acidic dipeptidase 2-like isoform X2 [Clytia hemisphaerica]|uniref:Uncharacterized protein n=1 Tax=Clytia hemisphaerica TaxID=252671 RepID=A0A7M5UKP1_9CNID